MKRFSERWAILRLCFSVSLARYTVAMPPVPISSSISYLPMRSGFIRVPAPRHHLRRGPQMSSLASPSMHKRSSSVHPGRSHRDIAQSQVSNESRESVEMPGMMPDSVIVLASESTAMLAGPKACPPAVSNSQTLNCSASSKGATVGVCDLDDHLSALRRYSAPHDESPAQAPEQPPPVWMSLSTSTATAHRYSSSP